MKSKTLAAALFAGTAFAGFAPAFAGQALYGTSAPNFPVSSHDHVYTGDQFSNTVSVIDPSDNKTLGVIQLGAPSPANFSPLYKVQVLVHGMGFSPDHRTIGVGSIGLNSVAFIDTATNTVRHITYVGRAPHEPFWTPDGKEVWVTVRGENYVDVLNAKTFKEKTRIITPPGSGMTIFSPNDKYGYVGSSFKPVTDVVSVASHKIIATVKQVTPFCPNIAATPDGNEVWMTLKDSGKNQVFNAKLPFNTLKILDTGPITKHVNIVDNAHGSFAYVTVGGLNEVKVFRTDDFSQVATIPIGELPHGLWPSDDGSRIYVGLENGDAVTAIDTLTNKVIATMPIGQAPQTSTSVPAGVSNAPLVRTSAFSLNTPLDHIAANKRGKAVLERDLPGLMASRSYPLFDDMSLSQIATMSGGRLNQTKLNLVQADLARLSSSAGDRP